MRESAVGRCLCGGVRYTTSGPLRDVIDCHCHRCRRFTGHHMAATSVDVSHLEIDDPDDLLTWWWPVPEAGYAFCRRCGSSLFWRAGESAARWTICAGTLDPPTHLRTVAAWWVSEASDYVTRPDVPEHLREPEPEVD